jgi:hypothetical protein
MTVECAFAKVGFVETGGEISACESVLLQVNQTTTHRKKAIMIPRTTAVAVFQRLFFLLGTAGMVSIPRFDIVTPQQGIGIVGRARQRVKMKCFAHQ